MHMRRMMNISRLDYANAKILENFASTKSREKQIKHISPHPIQPHFYPFEHNLFNGNQTQQTYKYAALLNSCKDVQTSEETPHLPPPPNKYTDIIISNAFEVINKKSFYLHKARAGWCTNSIILSSKIYKNFQWKNYLLMVLFSRNKLFMQILHCPKTHICMYVHIT